MALCVLAVGALLVLRAVLRLRRVLSALPTDPAPLAAWLRRAGPGGLDELAERLEPARDGVLGRLARELVEARGEALVGVCNEALHEVEGELAWGQGAGGASLRACLFVTAFAAAASLGLRRGPSVELFDALALGAGIALTLAAAERASERAARDARLALDRWVDAALSRGREGPSLPRGRPG
ncbi:MAG TPA: hypothetical protein VFS43_34980 [Polyangiaceae bacterium]|nr:hypothetical protein [Polyangiaceae bacterium]